VYEFEDVITTYSVNPINANKQEMLARMIGNERYGSLDDASRDFLGRVVGSLNFGVTIDIDKTLAYSFLNEQR
jgi:hypothetical protein